MLYQPMEELLPRSGNSIYKLIRMAANRAMELADGKPKLTEKNSSDKLATIALEEIRAGKVMLKDVGEKLYPTKGGKGQKEDKKNKEDIPVEVAK